MLVASEYRYGTMRPTILFTPIAPASLCQRLSPASSPGSLFAVVGEAIGWASYAIISGRGVAFALSSGDVQLLLGDLGSVALWGAIGVGLGAMLRNQVGAVITMLAWASSSARCCSACSRQ